MKKKRLSNGRSFAFLIAIFLFFFAAPVIFLTVFGYDYLGLSDRFDATAVSEGELFSSVNIKGRGSFIKVQSSDKLGPAQEKDFLVIAWFNIQDLPESGQRMFLLSRHGPPTVNSTGYAIAISRTLSAFKPEVYWRDRKGEGGWFSFADVKLLPGYWFMVALTYYEDSKLGLFVGNYDLNGKVRLVKSGGYDLGKPVMPIGDYPLKIGSIKTGLFAGSVGPVGVFAKKSLRSQVQPILKSFIRDPLAVPDQINDEDILLWSPDGKTDLSPLNHELKFIDPVSGRSEELHDL